MEVNLEEIETLNKQCQTTNRLNSIDIKYLQSKFNKRKTKCKSFKKEWQSDWTGFTLFEKILFISACLLKIMLALFCLYTILLSLNFMSIGFTLVSSRVIQHRESIEFIFGNPFSAFSLGLFLTSLIQNSTVTTSIAIILVSSGIISRVSEAVFIIMGANFGTCITNSLIAMTSMNKEQNEFERSFSAATLNDGFNLFTILILFPLEVFTGFLDHLSHYLVHFLQLDNNQANLAKTNFIGKLVGPVCDLFIKLNQTAADLVSSGNLSADYSKVVQTNSSYWSKTMVDFLGETTSGFVWILLSITVLITSLFCLVKIINRIICGPLSKNLRIILTTNIKSNSLMNLITEITLFLIAILLTVIVQSSNILTATIVPLCGIGIISLQQVYVMTLGANIGTTVTGVLTALAQPTSSTFSFQKSIQLAFVYTLFNLIGVLLWLPIKHLRLPIGYANKLGRIVTSYGWFIHFYVLGLFFMFPLVLFGIALIPNWIGLVVFGIPIIALLITFVTIRLLQINLSSILPDKLKTFNFLPEWLTSLKPYDKQIKKLKCCCCCCNSILIDNNGSLNDNLADFIRRRSTIVHLVDEARKHQIESTNFIQNENNTNEIFPTEYM